MYREVFVPVDNSPHSNWACDRAIELAAALGGRLTGSHVYAARLHDIRFRQLETGLPTSPNSGNPFASFLLGAVDSGTSYFRDSLPGGR